MASEQESAALDLDAPLIVVTADSHFGPRLREDLREYCPRQYLEEYDAYVKAYEPLSDPGKLRESLGGEGLGEQGSSHAQLTNDTAGHYDVHQRLKDMDRDGIAAEVIYHGSQNGQCFPLLPTMGGTFNSMVFSPGVCSPHELELAAVGQRMYNRWLADQCSVQPERHVGLAHVPMWDVAAATREVEWASSVGLKGVNFPGPKLGIPAYDELVWEPFWSTCEELGMTLSTHAGTDLEGLGSARPHNLLMLTMSEVGEKILPRLVFGGVFERHPNLGLALTELQKPYSRWWPALVREYDQLWATNRETLGEQVPRPPSEYLAKIYHGNSLLFLAPDEVKIAKREGYADRYMWGSDYPHAEGPYRIPKDEESETMTMLALRHALSGVEPRLARGIAGENAVDLYGLDREKLLTVAARIEAVNLKRLATPLDSIPPDWKSLAKATVVFPEYLEFTQSAE